jgi:hypothetical protein
MTIPKSQNLNPLSASRPPVAISCKKRVMLLRQGRQGQRAHLNVARAALHAEAREAAVNVADAVPDAEE